MISRSTLIGALVVVELAIVGVAFSAVDRIGAMGPAAFAFGSSPGSVGSVDAGVPRLDKTLPAGVAPHVLIDLRDADVRIDTSGQPAVRVTDMLRVTGYLSGTIPPVTADATPDGVRIATIGSGGHVLIGALTHQVRIVVPPSARVEIVSAGRIDAAGLRAKLVAHTPDGEIHVRDHRGDLDVSSASGKIELIDVRGDDIAANTHHGRLYFTRVGAERIDGHTNYGRIYAVDVNAHNGALSTHSGRVSASFTGDSDATVAVSTRDGHVTVSGLPNTRLGSSARSVQLGQGRGQFEVTTDDGDVNISQGASV